MGRTPKKIRPTYDADYFESAYKNIYTETLRDFEKQANQAKIMTQSQLEELKRMIKEGAMAGNGKTANTISRRKVGVKPPASQSYITNDIDKFTDQTHGISLTYGTGSLYNEYISRKIVGMDKVEWWEYILVYGFLKAAKLSIEYQKVKHLIEKGETLTRSKNLKTLVITLRPLTKNYPEKKLYVELPHRAVSKVEEYESGYFLYEDTYQTQEIDNNQFRSAVEKFLIASKVHESLINKVLNQHGRLSGF